MARNWIGSEGKILFECKHCHREVFAKPYGTMTVHRHKGKRVRCDASGDPVTKHKRVN